MNKMDFSMKFGDQIYSVNQDEAIGAIINLLLEKDIVKAKELKEALLNCQTVQLTKAPKVKKIRIVELDEEEVE